MRWLAILGIGEDGVEGLSGAALALLRHASLVVGGARHLALADSAINGERMPWPRPIADAFPAILARRGQPVAVLASGDPYCYGIGTALAGVVPVAETICLPAPSAFSLACARLGWSLQDTVTLSFCGRPIEAILPRLHPGARILALSADAGTPAAVAALLDRRGFGPSRLTILESLGPRERMRTTTAASGVPGGIDPLNLLAIEVVAAPGAKLIPLASGLPDACFEHDGQLTRREVRAVTLSALAPLAGERLWDIGCGAGSIAIEWLLRHPANRAIGIEARPDRAERAARNAAELGVPALRIVTGHAPEALQKLDPPDAVFIGGGAHREGVIETAWAALRPGGRLVANSVTVETDAKILAARTRLGGTLTRLSVERLDAVGGMHGFRPAMTVTQWAVQKP
jgi:precorrin-6Y C5,15-methyltransferase (decarboxylating)